jgi:uncharacterized protein (DUF2345 family)
MTLTSGGVMNLVGDDIGLSASDVSITSTGSGNGTITLLSNETMNLTSTTTNVDIKAANLVNINTTGTGSTVIGNASENIFLMTTRGCAIEEAICVTPTAT